MIMAHIPKPTLEVVAVLTSMSGVMLAMGTLAFDEWYLRAGREAEQFALVSFMSLQALAIVFGIARWRTATGKSATIMAAILLAMFLFFAG